MDHEIEAKTTAAQPDERVATTRVLVAHLRQTRATALSLDLLDRVDYLLDRLAQAEARERAWQRCYENESRQAQQRITELTAERDAEYLRGRREASDENHEYWQSQVETVRRETFKTAVAIIVGLPVEHYIYSGAYPMTATVFRDNAVKSLEAAAHQGEQRTVSGEGENVGD